MTIKTFLKHLMKDAHYKIAFFTAAALIISMVAAAVFVYANGNNQNITIQDSDGTESTENADPSGQEETGGTLFVDLEGCVKKPGVYEVPPGSRVFEVIEKAGGLTDEADTSGINQAETVTDGMKLDIPSESDKKESAGSAAVSQGSASSEEGLININTADSLTLQEIPGVGPVTAEKIITYREQNGAFKSIEEITAVSGIGEKTFEKIRSKITC